MAQITPVKTSIAGVNPAGDAADAGGDSVANHRGQTLIRLDNGSGGSITATIAAQVTSRPGDATFPRQTVANQAVVIPAGEVRVIGPIPPSFTDANGNVQLTYSGVTSLTIEAFEP